MSNQQPKLLHKTLEKGQNKPQANRRKEIIKRKENSKSREKKQ